MYTVKQENLRHDLDLPGSWVVAGFNSLSLGQVKSTSEYKIEVLFHKLKEAANQSPCKWSLGDTQRLLTRPLATALLWNYGSVLKDGVWIGDRSTNVSPLRTMTVCFDTALDKTLIIDRDEKDENGEFYLNTRYAREQKIPPLGKFLLIKILNSEEEYIVPCFEIFKTYYAWSRGLTQSILSPHIFAPNKYIFDGEHSSFDIESKTAIVKLRSHIRGSDAKVICRLFLSEHAEYATKLLQNSYKKYLADSKDSLSCLVSQPPFYGPEKWQCKAIRLPSKVKRFLITHITQTSSDWGVKFFVYQRDNPGAKARGDQDENEGSDGSEQKDNSKNPGPPPKDNEGELDDGLDETNTSSADWGSNEVVVYPVNQCRHVETPYGLEDTYEGQPKNKTREHGPGENKPPTEGSPDKGNKKKADTSKLSVGDKDQDETDETLTGIPIQVSYFSDLAYLAWRLENFLIKHIKLSEDAKTIDNRIFNPLPVGQSKAAWCFSDSKKKKPRLVEIVEIDVSGQFVYYLELQRRKNYHVGFALIYHHNFDTLSIKEINLVLSEFVEIHCLSNRVNERLPDTIKVEVKKHFEGQLPKRSIKMFDRLKKIGLEISTTDQKTMRKLARSQKVTGD